jgi:invasion protein IalB
MTLIRFRLPSPLLAALAVAALSPVGALSPAANAAEPAAPAPVSAEPQATTSSYGDWTVRCLRTETPTAARICEVAQSLQVQGQQAPIAQIVLSRPNPKEAMRIIVQLPANISLPSSVKVFADDKDPQPVELAWRRCLPAGCFADAELKDEAIKHFRAQTANGKMMFKDGNGRELALPFSFRGFPQAMDGLTKGQ